MRPEIAFIADDFTGASDVLATLARAGRRSRLYLAPPDSKTDPDFEALDAFGVATAARSLSAEEIANEMDEIGMAIADIRPRFLHYKVCSTFDSSPQIGSIGAAIRALQRHVRSPLIAVLGGQPNLGRYLVFGNLFALAPDGDVHRIDRHPVMRGHPVTPMGEADLRRHLEAQGLNVKLVSRSQYREREEETADHLARYAGDAAECYLFDVLDQADLAIIGRMLHHTSGPGRILMCVGGSSVAEALTSGSTSRPITQETSPLKKPILAFAGSRSALSASQVQLATAYQKVAINPIKLAAEGALAVEQFARDIRNRLSSGQHVLAHLQPKDGHGLLPFHIAELSAEIIAASCRDDRVGALVIAGGDTSSAAVSRLGLEWISYCRDIDPGVPLCAGARVRGIAALPLVMKGGQMGRHDLFDHLVREVFAEAVVRK